MNPAGLEKLIGYTFADASLLQRAITHRSAGAPHNERLEFLGDGLLNFVIAEAIFGQWPKADEGDLSRWRAQLVCEETLASIGKALKLSDYLKMGSGELKSGGYRRESILADTFEAILGAVYLDGGFAAAQAVVRQQFADMLSNPPQPETLKDSKTRLQEALQAVPRPLPEYRVLEEHGPPHRRVFKVECVLADGPLQTTALGPSRKQAEQDAAKAMMILLKEHAHA